MREIVYLMSGISYLQLYTLPWYADMRTAVTM